MMTAGLTGGLASGKSSAAALFASFGAAVIDADDISHSLTAAGGIALPPLRAALGDWAFTAEGTLDRAAVRRRAFSEPPLRRLLEQTLHPMIAAEMRRQKSAAESAAGEYVLLVAPLLLEAGEWAAECDRVVVVDCAAEMQLARAVRRGMSAAAARQIIAVQMTREERNARADDIIKNDGDMASLAEAVRKSHFAILNSSERGRQ